MVHALGEIRRVLAPNGILIDLRPVMDRWQIEVVSMREVHEMGRVQDLPTMIADDEAAHQAVAQASTQGLFSREQEEFFPYYYVWDAPSEMEETLGDEWDDLVSVAEETRQGTRSAWALGGADAQVRVRVKMLITRWRAAA